MQQVNKREKKQLRQREKLRVMRAHSEIETHDPRRKRGELFPCATTSYTENMLIYCIYTDSAIYDCEIRTPLYTAKGTVPAESYLLFNTIFTIHHRVDHGYQSGLFNCNTICYNAIRVSAEPVGSIL